LLRRVEHGKISRGFEMRRKISKGFEEWTGISKGQMSRGEDLFRRVLHCCGVGFYLGFD